MNVVFSSQDPLNTSAIDLETDETLFTVYTESKFMGGQTTVRKPGKMQAASSSSSSKTSEDGSAGYVAQIDWHKTRPSVVRIGKRVMPLSMFLHHEHIGGAFGLWVIPPSVHYFWPFDKEDTRRVAPARLQGRTRPNTCGNPRKTDSR